MTAGAQREGAVQTLTGKLAQAVGRLFAVTDEHNGLDFRRIRCPCRHASGQRAAKTGQYHK